MSTATTTPAPGPRYRCKYEPCQAELAEAELSTYGPQRDPACPHCQGAVELIPPPAPGAARLIPPGPGAPGFYEEHDITVNGSPAYNSTRGRYQFFDEAPARPPAPGQLSLAALADVPIFEAERPRRLDIRLYMDRIREIQIEGDGTTYTQYYQAEPLTGLADVPIVLDDAIPPGQVMIGYLTEAGPPPSASAIKRRQRLIAQPIPGGRPEYLPEPPDVPLIAALLAGEDLRPHTPAQLAAALELAAYLDAIRNYLHSAISLALINMLIGEPSNEMLDHVLRIAGARLRIALATLDQRQTEDGQR